MESLGYDPGDMFPLHPLRSGSTPRAPEYEEWIGLRADERRRLALHRGKHWMVFPLASAGVVEADVRAFWTAQPFDLQIPYGEGNCRLCFEKGGAQLINVVRDAPDEGGVERWIAREVFARARMNPRRSYHEIAARARRQLPMFEAPSAEPDGRPCLCGD